MHQDFWYLTRTQRAFTWLGVVCVFGLFVSVMKHAHHMRTLITHDDPVLIASLTILLGLGFLCFCLLGFAVWMLIMNKMLHGTNAQGAQS